MSRNAIGVLFGAVTVVILTIIGSFFAPSAWLPWLDNIHWTASSGAATLLAWMGYRQAYPEQREPRRWFLLGIASYFTGQLCWDIQSALGWNPFPAPADLFYLLLGPCCILGLLSVLKLHLSHAKLTAAKLDMAVMTIAVIGLILLIYLSHQTDSNPLQLLVLVFYPAGLLSAACFALLLVPFLRLRMQWGWLLLLGGLALEGGIWMQWNLNVIDKVNIDGSLLNHVFSASDLLLGLGAMHWMATPSGNRTYVRICQWIQRAIPITAMLIAISTIYLMMTDTATPIAKSIALASCLSIIALAMVRQSILLAESERLLTAEQLIEEGQLRYQHLAHHDILTGLPNRLLFQDRLTHALALSARNNNRVGMLFIDIDHFKNINDSLGHVIGDELLVAIVERLKLRIREQDTFARLGGDEFVLLIEQLQNASEAATIASNLLEALKAPFHLSGNCEVVISASIGISVCPEDTQDATQLIRNADSAMYRAKDTGRNRYQFYTEELTKRAQERLMTESRLRQAIREKAFVLHYQPIYAKSEEGDMPQISSCECLIRWQQEDGSLIYPDHFIPCAEETGLIIPIGEWVLDHACGQLAEWDNRFPDNTLSMAVNISARHFCDTNFVMTVHEVLKRHGIAPGRLTIEITENAVMDRMDIAIPTLQTLVRTGVHIALDDFGTGQSSLAKLKTLPIHALKIDREFVKDIPDSTDDMQLAASIIRMAQGLHLETVAEGVETQEQYDFLAQAGCDKFQGYLLSRPVTADKIYALLTTSPELATA
ncbi:putative bifunctional diguanylate cyclase/phosphodiesterase [Methylovorus mays]|uniref:putative bifunctional diguanylate cyclase/phosphodiesterase n=1 Tax=Methylovorus mays TaxID=184077 RepID=UPI001E60E3AC|nr:EAL domain-containing protein [Methylovorus mays]MCB5208252.1 EAL domain-containing protein [Methylovorus mays]